MSRTTIANPACYSCLGTGRTIWEGFDGMVCPCVAICACGEEIPWAHDGEDEPEYCLTCQDERATGYERSGA